SHSGGITQYSMLRMRFEAAGVYRANHSPQIRGARRADPGVIAKPAPLAIVEGCKYDVSVIAAMIALKFAFHQPTYRQQDWFAQCGWFPSRSTINEQMNTGAATLS